MLSDPPIVISGGSITIEFDDNQLTPVGSGKHANPNKKISRIEITGDGVDPIDLNVPSGKVTVKIHYDDP